jgi:hypothetical protein
MPVRRLLAVALAAAGIPAALAAQRPAAPPPAQRPGAAAQARIPLAAAATAAAATVWAFYAFHFSHDMAFTRAAVRARRPWLSPDLLARCRAYFAKPDDPNEVPAIDGDPFTDSQEYPRTFRVGAATVEGDTARVPVAMVWPGTDGRIVTVVLVSVGGAWRIADVRYAGGEPSLRELLASGS